MTNIVELRSAAIQSLEQEVQNHRRRRGAPAIRAAVRLARTFLFGRPYSSDLTIASEDARTLLRYLAKYGAQTYRDVQFVSNAGGLQ